MIRRIALAMIVFNVACVALNFHLRHWERVLTDFTDVLQWGLVWTLATQIDRLEKQNQAHRRVVLSGRPARLKT